MSGCFGTPRTTVSGGRCDRRRRLGVDNGPVGSASVWTTVWRSPDANRGPLDGGGARPLTDRRVQARPRDAGAGYLPQPWALSPDALGPSGTTFGSSATVSWNAVSLPTARTSSNMNRLEIPQALDEAVISWAVRSPVRGQRFWRREVSERKRIVEVLRTWTPRRPSGPCRMRSASPSRSCCGSSLRSASTGGSPQSRGRRRPYKGWRDRPAWLTGARVIRSAKQLGEIEQREILVLHHHRARKDAGLRGRAAVSDIGGLMCHSATSAESTGCRQWSAPARAPSSS